MQTTTNLQAQNTPPQPPDISPAAVPSEPERELTIKERAALYRQKAVDALVAVLDDERAGHMAKITAANSLLDRSDGKATQYVENTIKVQTLPELLKEIGEREKAYQGIIVDAHIVEPKLIETKPLTLEDLI